MEKHATSPVSNDYFTKGKQYPIISEKEETFVIRNNKGQLSVCNKNGASVHIGGKKWEIKES